MADFQLALFGEEAFPSELPMGGVDDMNFVEILHSLPGKRRPPEDKLISVPWERGERSYYVEYSSNLLFIEWEAKRRAGLDSGEKFYVKVEAPKSKGLPTNLAGDVLVALMKQTADNGFTEAQIRTSRHELIKVMRWHSNGSYYRRLEGVLSQFAHMTVATNALWDPGRQSYYRGEFNVLDSWELEETTDNDPKAPLLVRWGKKTLDIFKRGYMKHLNTEVYYDLPNPTTKRIYRWLDKHLSLYPVVEIDVLRFAHKILGYGVSYRYPSKVIGKLGPKFDTLQDRGFCLWETQKSGSDSGKKFVFTRVTDYVPAATLPRRDFIVGALEERGVDHAEQLVDQHSWEECLRQIAYFEWRTRNGKPVDEPGAWLSNAIRKSHTLPKALAAQMDAAREKTAEWCQRMYEALTDEEQRDLDVRVGKLVAAGRNRSGRTYGDDRPLQLRLRNQLLLNRMREA